MEGWVNPDQVESGVGTEPRTPRMKVHCSTNWAIPSSGHCGQTCVPIRPATSWFVLAPPWGHSSRPCRFNSFRIKYFWAMGRLSWGSHQENHQWHLVGQGTFQQLLWLGLLWGGDSGSSDRLALSRSLGVTLHMWWLVQWEVGSWGSHAGSASTWTCIQCPQIYVLPCILRVLNRGMVNLCVVWTCPWTLSRQNS